MEQALHHTKIITYKGVLTKMKKIKKKPLLFVFVLVATVVLTACDSGPQERGLLADTIGLATERAEALTESLTAFTGVQGLTIAIVDAETGFTWTQGFGYADTTNNIPVTEDTVFMIASVSKLFTAIAAMQLVEQGLIDLDEPIVTYLPNFSILPHFTDGGDYRNITTRMLLNYTSGLPMEPPGVHWPDLFTHDGHDDEFLNSLLMLLHNTNMIAQEGTRTSYSNAGMELLGILMASMAGYDNYFEGFVNLTNGSLFEPLGLTLTSYVLNDEIIENMSLAYINHLSQHSFIGYYNALPSGSMVSNANEMAILMHAILRDIMFDDGQLLQQETFNQMLDISDAPRSRYAMGHLRVHWGLGIKERVSASGISHFGHGGMGEGHHAEMIFHPETGIGVFVSVNSDVGRIVSTMLSEELLVSAVNEKMGN